MFILSFYVPETHLEIVKTALFKIGAGKYENYDSCCWQVKGEGQFRPLGGSNPFIGTLNEIEKVSEYKVEMIVNALVIKDVVKELIDTHPYEEPAYSVVEMKSIDY